MTTRFKQRQVLFLINAGLVAATLIAYEPIRHNDFVNYDDRLYITENPNVNKGLTVDSVIQAFTKPYALNWHPVTWLSHIVDCEIYGLNPVGHHITSVVIHTVNSVLLFWVLLRMTKATWASGFVAAVFAVHPVHVESVAWAAERKDVLSGLFWILTMLAYVRYAERPNFKRYSLVLLAFAMGIMSKPMVVTLPFVLLLLDWWPLERIGVSGGQSPPYTSSAKQILIEKVPLFAMSAVSSVITLTAQRSGGTVATLEHISAGGRLANMFVSYIRYTGKALWPNRLAVFYPHTRPDFSDAATIICAILFVLITVFSIDIGRRRKYIAAGWLWFLGVLVPVIGLVQVGAQGIANRYLYLPMLGLSMIAAWAVKDLVNGRPRWRVVAAVTAAAVLLSGVILTRMQVSRWRNSITLFEYTLQVTENNTLAENNYGSALLEAGRLKEAELYLSDALRRVPTFADARNNLGKVFLYEGRFDEAVDCFNALIRNKRGSAEVYYNLGMAAGMQGKYDDAIQYFGRGIELNPEYPEIQKRMGTSLLATGRTNDAIEYLNEALRINPYETVVYVSISIAYIKTGNYEQAFENWAKAEELQLNSDYVFNNPAWLIATAGDVSAEDANNAIEFAERACKLKAYKEPGLLDTLAAAYAAGGRFEDAVKTAQRAIDIAKARGQKEMTSKIEKRLELYRAGKRYTQK
jgi:tetratricopeptide (TPR) repeat protein